MTRNRLYLLILIVSMAGYILVYFNVTDPEIANSDRSLCIIKNVSGIPCPSCGTTRSVSAIVAGNFKVALFLNPFGYIVTLILLLAPFLVVTDILLRKDHFWQLFSTIENFLKRPWVAAIFILLVIANWIWNIKKGL